MYSYDLFAEKVYEFLKLQLQDDLDEERRKCDSYVFLGSSILVWIITGQDSELTRLHPISISVH